jgi:putative transposase
MARRKRPPGSTPAAVRSSHRRFDDVERMAILDACHSERFCDKSVREIYATLLDEGSYLGSISTYYRVLRAAGESRERRAVASHPTMLKPELAAGSPGQVWSWDITKLLGPQKWTYYYLYVVLDVFSRYVVAWGVYTRESEENARALFMTAIGNEAVNPRQLTVHADRGSTMTSKSLTQLFAELGVTKSHSRPHVSNDNPYSEAHFKTLKYGSSYPRRFASLQQARAYCRQFVDWYNNDHRHSGLALLTPADVHLGRAAQRQAARAAVLAQAWRVHPERFVRGCPRPLQLEPIAYINRPDLTSAA